MHRLTLLAFCCFALAGCTEQVAACPTPGDLRHEDGRCAPPGLDAGAEPTDAEADGSTDCTCATDEVCLASGECVECTSDGDCVDSVCDRGTNTCVECNTSADCPSTDRPTCTAGVCVDTCDRALCTERFPREAPACDPMTGACVACLPDENEEMDCGGRSCDPSTLRCTTTDLHSLDFCEACVRSTECATGSGCVETFFDDPPRSVGSYCLVAPVGAEECPRGAPFRLELAAVDDSTPRTYCTPTTLTTCPAILDTSMCTGSDASGCGVTSEADASCHMGRCRAHCDSGEPFSCAAGRCVAGGATDPDLCLP